MYHSLSSFNTVSGLKCYQCTGDDDSCSKEKLQADSSKQTTCPPTFDRCMRVWGKKDGKILIANTCSNQALCEAAEDAKCEGDKCAVGCCDSDLCNAASPISFSVFLMTICSALGLALLK